MGASRCNLGMGKTPPLGWQSEGQVQWVVGMLGPATRAHVHLFSWQRSGKSASRKEISKSYSTATPLLPEPFYQHTIGSGEETSHPLKGAGEQLPQETWDLVTARGQRAHLLTVEAEVWEALLKTDFDFHGVCERASGRAGGGQSLVGINIQRIRDDPSFGGADMNRDKGLMRLVLMV